MISTWLAVDGELDVVACGVDEGCGDGLLLGGEFVGVEQAVTGGVDVAEFGEGDRLRSRSPAGRRRSTTMPSSVSWAAAGAAPARIASTASRRERSQRVGSSVVVLGPSSSAVVRAAGRRHRRPRRSGSAASALSGLVSVPTAVAPTRQVGRFGES